MIYFLGYIFLEVTVSVYCASFLGGLYTFLEIIFSAFIGIFLLKNFKYSLMMNIKSLTKGEITQADFVKQNVANAIGAFLLIMPGFLTDIIGILLQFGLITTFLTKLFKFKINPQNMSKDDKKEDEYYEQTGFNYTNYTKKRRYDDDEIIDVEVINDNKSIKY